MGHEVYATCVKDVEAVLTRMGDRIEELQSRPVAPAAQQPAELSSLASAILSIPCDTKPNPLPLSRGYQMGWRRALVEAAKLTAPSTVAQQPAELTARAIDYLDALECECCDGTGWVWKDEQVGERESDVQTLKTGCPACGELGWLGPDAEARAAIKAQGGSQ
jgi:hypothetical protein